MRRISVALRTATVLTLGALVATGTTTARAGVPVTGGARVATAGTVEFRPAAPLSYGPSASSPPSSTRGWNRPALAAVTFGSTTRLLRSVTTAPRDTVDSLGQSTQYLDVGRPGGWRSAQYATTMLDSHHSSAAPAAASLNNYVADGATLHTFDQITLPERTVSGRLDGTYLLRHRISTNHGAGWQTAWSVVHMRSTPAVQSGLHLYQGVIRLPDGTWVMPTYYGRPTGTGRYTTAVGLVASRDHGRNWYYTTTVFFGSSRAYSEATVTQLPSGRLEVVARWDAFGDARNPGILQFRTTDRAVTGYAGLSGSWSSQVPSMPGAYGESRGYYGASPRLTRVGSRVLLSFGRPGPSTTWSVDGVHWSPVQHLYANRPASTVGCRATAAQTPCSAMGTSGYLGVAAVSGTAGYIVGDNCHLWSCTNLPAGMHVPSTLQYTWLVRFDVR